MGPLEEPLEYEEVEKWGIKNVLTVSVVIDCIGNDDNFAGALKVDHQVNDFLTVMYAGFTKNFTTFE